MSWRLLPLPTQAIRPFDDDDDDDDDDDSDAHIVCSHCAHRSSLEMGLDSVPGQLCRFSLGGLTVRGSSSLSIICQHSGQYGKKR